MDATTVWGSGIMHIIQGFYKFGLRPYLERYEASIVNYLLPIEDRNRIEVEFDFNALLRADQGERFKTFKEAIMGGFMTPNQARAEEGWIAMDGGDSLFLQQQMTPVDQLASMDRGASPASDESANLSALVRGLTDAVN
jgi:phage portal protein BeeE